MLTNQDLPTRLLYKKLIQALSITELKGRKPSSLVSLLLSLITLSSHITLCIPQELYQNQGSSLVLRYVTIC